MAAMPFLGWPAKRPRGIRLLGDPGTSRGRNIHLSPYSTAFALYEATGLFAERAPDERPYHASGVTL
jgi:hypothetical protein